MKGILKKLIDQYDGDETSDEYDVRILQEQLNADERSAALERKKVEEK